MWLDFKLQDFANFARITEGQREIAHKGRLGWDGAHHMARFNGVGAQ